MEQVFESLKEVEKKIGIFLSDDENAAETIMIENAAMALETEVKNACSKKNDVVTVLCGSGNNGADGYTLCRRLCGFCKINVVKIQEPKSFHCIQSFSNLKKVFENSNTNISFYELALMQGNTSVEKVVKHSDVIVDCIFGTGFHGVVDLQVQKLFSVINNSKAYRIACDIPSGLDSTGENISSLSLEEKTNFVFFADKTVSMGAHKVGLFSDAAKDCIGKITFAPIGVSDELFYQKAEEVFPDRKIFLLKKSDLKSPERKEQNSHKGKYGHVCVIAGNKAGAGIIAASSAFKCGAGLSSLLVNDGLNFENFKIPVSIMTCDSIPDNANSFVIGPGFGRENDIEKYFDFIKEKLSCAQKASAGQKLSGEQKLSSAGQQISVVLDADSFYYRQTVDFIEENEKASNPLKLVLTPHPKEFSILLKLSGFGEPSVKETCDKRLEFVRCFCSKYKNTVLVLKGANTFIGCGKDVYISTAGSCALAKGGSGDVLAGITAGLLAQKYEAKDAAVTAVLMHAQAASKVEKNYSLTPELLIEKL